MRFQTQNKYLFNMAMNFAGHLHHIGRHGVVEVTHADALAQIAALGPSSGWVAVSDDTPVDLEPPPAHPAAAPVVAAPTIPDPVPDAPRAPLEIKGAKEFVEACAADPSIADKFQQFKSDAVRHSYARSIGYQFTGDELARAVREHGVKEYAETVVKEEPPEAPAETKPLIPTEDMPREVLLKMADAFSLQYSKNVTKRKLVSRIQAAMQ